MSDTNIAWADKVWNPIVGCSKVSAGCRNCYAEVMGRRLRAMALAKVEKEERPGKLGAYLEAVDERGRWTGKVVTMPEALGEPLKWRKPARIFVNSMSDLFHPGVPFEFIAAVFGVMAACPQHTFLVLTKRPERAVEFFRWLDTDGAVDIQQHTVKLLRAHGVETGCGSCFDHDDWPLPNVHLGVSVEDQATADERIPVLLQCPAAVRWVSYEPALGPVDFSSALSEWGPGLLADTMFNVGVRRVTIPCLDWAVVGGESGPNARPFDVAWARSVVRQCRDAGVACYVKQLGARPYNGTPAAGWDVFANGVSCRDRAGSDPSEWPEDLRVREFPECAQ